MACRFNLVPVIEFLLQAGAKIDQKGEVFIFKLLILLFIIIIICVNFSAVVS